MNLVKTTEIAWNLACPGECPAGRLTWTAGLAFPPLPGAFLILFCHSHRPPCLPSQSQVSFERTEKQVGGTEYPKTINPRNPTFYWEERTHSCLGLEHLPCAENFTSMGCDFHPLYEVRAFLLLFHGYVCYSRRVRGHLEESVLSFHCGVRRLHSDPQACMASTFYPKPSL